MLLSLLLRNCAELTLLDTSAALETLSCINNVRILYATLDSVCGTNARAECTTLTLISIDNVTEEALTYACGTLLINVMSYVLIAEEAESGKNGVRSCLTETAERCALYVVCKLLKLIEVFELAVALCDLIEDLEHTNCTDTAGCALTAGLVYSELKEELCKVNHTGVFIHYDKTAGAHHRACCDKVIEVDRSINKRSRETSAGGATCLSCFELLAVGDTATDLLDYLTESCSHGNLYETCVCDLTAESEYLCTCGLFSTDGLEPVSAVKDDLSDICISLNVVKDGRLSKETLYCRERRTGTGLTALTLNTCHKSCFLAAYECARTETELDIELEACAEDVIAEKAVLSCLIDSDLETVYSDGVLCTDVDITLVSADSVTCDSHCLKNCVGVTLEDRTVHECTGVTLVTVTANVLLAFASHSKLPLKTCGEACAAAAAGTGIEDRLNDLFTAHLCENLTQCEVTVASDILVDLFGVDNTAVTESDSHLLLIESSIVKRRSSALSSLFLSCLVVNESFNYTTLYDMLGNDLGNILSLYSGVECAVGIYDHDGTESAKTETTGLNYLDLFFKAGSLDLCIKRINKLQAAGGSTTCTSANKNV